MYEHPEIFGIISEESCRENGYKWLIVDESFQRHWLTGREFAASCPRTVGTKVVLTYRSYGSFSLYYATKA